jgi:hypothetical protein
MPRGTAFDLETLAVFKAKTVKKEGEEKLVISDPAGTAEHNFRLSGFILSTAAEATVKLLDGATVFCEFLSPAKTNTVVFFPGQGYASKTRDNELTLEISAEAAVTGTFFGTED